MEVSDVLEVTTDGVEGNLCCCCCIEDWSLDIWNDGVDGVNAVLEEAKMATAMADVNLNFIFFCIKMCLNVR